MKKSMLAWVVLGCSIAFGQTFEVASVKPAAPQTDGRIMVRMGGGPGTPDPGQLNYSNVSLKQVISNAYNVKAYQVSGPDWLDSQRYDIIAKVPEGVTKEQFNLMLQHLLAERFALELRHETKDFPLYELVVGKGGPKLKASVNDPNAAPADALLPPPGRITTDKNGFPQLPPGAAGRPMTMMSVMNGRLRMTSTHQTLPRLVDLLSNQVDRPVVDKTGLSGEYDVTLEFAPEGGSMMKGMPPPPPPPPGANVPSDNSGDAPSIYTAVQEQLGLKLDAKKGPLEFLVVTHAEKTPTEN